MQKTFEAPLLLVHENGRVVGATLGHVQREELRRHVGKSHDDSCKFCAGMIARLLDTLDAIETAMLEDRAIQQSAESRAQKAMEAVRAIRPYVRHDGGCRIIITMLTGTAPHLRATDCDCGLTEVLRASGVWSGREE